MQPLQQEDAQRSTELHQEVQHFYARQMLHLDNGHAVEWAATFTEDGVFAANAHPQPTQGRAQIESGAREAARKLAEQGLQRRHWLGMLQVDEDVDGHITARSYALIIETPVNGQAALRLSCTCDDVLVRVDGRLQVLRREVHRDDIR